MHIGMIYGENGPFPPDIRVEKEIKALCKVGHRVTVLTRRIPPDALIGESLFDGRAEIKRIAVNSGSFFSRQLRHFTLVEKNWFNALTDFIEKDNPDVLHVHDFDLVPTTLKMARKYDKPVVADLHENMPAANRAYRSNKPFHLRVTNGLLFNYHLWRYMESRCLKKCARIIVVVPEAAVRLYQYGIPSKKIVIVSNTEDETTFNIEIENADRKIIDKYRANWMACYIGNPGPHRGLDTVLRSLPQVISQIPNFVLLIVGARGEHRRELVKEAYRMKVENSVEFVGWVSMKEVNSYIFASRICLVPHNNFEHTQTTVPHKLFQAMLCRKPVLVSSCEPLKRIVSETQSGEVFEANNSTDFADKLIKMYQNTDALDKIGNNGYKAASGSYAWRHDAARLNAVYDDIKNLTAIP